MSPGDCQPPFSTCVAKKERRLAWYKPILEAFYFFSTAISFKKMERSNLGKDYEKAQANISND
jgi:hypothetical protein